ncbi:LRR receptor-like serine/threonine-protein kinase ERL2 [Camellia lanceoleosa]|uniref:LRR receptor-like serine/threonine-protein kinase ERL2 n=1 Tax=Camellia lanceoleosa TaxID=1840588 RepID=A0ACC0FC45_9ERIC|nr:LRR receptor-like serine/threonine-protein kinase ERL2 [Camellia lanceoleosa]
MSVFQGWDLNRFYFAPFKRAVTAVWDMSTWNRIGNKRLLKKPASIMSISLDGKYLALAKESVEKKVKKGGVEKLKDGASKVKDKKSKALMSIKVSFNNIANVLLDWDDVHNDDFCSWNLSNLNLGGEISPAIGDLKNLQSMYAFFANPVDLVFLLIVTSFYFNGCVSIMRGFIDNFLYGDIPFSISKLKRLELFKCENLKSIDGPIPSTLTQIPNLKTREVLACNQLIGEIPRLIYWNEVLQYLSLQGNRLTGKIPEVIGLMQALAVLKLQKRPKKRLEHVRCLEEDLGKLRYEHPSKLKEVKFHLFTCSEQAAAVTYECK